MEWSREFGHRMLRQHFLPLSFTPPSILLRHSCSHALLLLCHLIAPPPASVAASHFAIGCCSPLPVADFARHCCSEWKVIQCGRAAKQLAGCGASYRHSCGSTHLRQRERTGGLRGIVQADCIAHSIALLDDCSCPSARTRFTPPPPPHSPTLR